MPYTAPALLAGDVVPGRVLQIAYAEGAGLSFKVKEQAAGAD